LERKDCKEENKENLPSLRNFDTAKPTQMVEQNFSIWEKQTTH
jgi:hypothetical protein